MIDVNELMDYQKKRNMQITLRRSQEDRKGAKTAQGGMRESFEKNQTNRRNYNMSSLMQSEYENMSEYAKM